MSTASPGKRASGRSAVAGALSATVLVALGASLALAPIERASGSFKTGLLGYGYASANAEARTVDFDATVAAGAQIARIHVHWRSVARTRPANPADPADPAYDFTRVDTAVSEASARGLAVLLTVYGAPDYAEGPGRNEQVAPGSWRPDPAAFSDFGSAVAARYSGSFAGLPRVRFFEVWNEANLYSYLTPTWVNGKPAAARHYRRMVNPFSRAVKAVRRGNKVVAGATSPYGDDPGGLRIRPLVFLRELLCLERRGGELRDAGCRRKTRLDILSHHPISLTGGPRASARHPDDATVPDFKHVVRTMRAAERAGTVTGGRHPVWATEIWWETKPPEGQGVSYGRQARWLTDSLYVLWKQGAKAVINLTVRDQPPTNLSATIDSGLIASDGQRKPAFQAFRFPFVVDRRADGDLFAWARTPVGGRANIQRRKGGGWHTVATAKARAGKVLTKRIRGRARKGSFRIEVGTETSRPWRVR